MDQLKDHGYTTSQRFVTQLENNANAIEALTEATAGATSQESKEIKDEFSYQAQIDKMANDENIVYIAIIDKNVIDIADSIAEDIGNDYSDDETMKAASSGRHCLRLRILL
ncbi:hypothetical protein [Acetobacterium wieringae]|uniref:hypothetical protein n=1 Tax=Acetobacterium wieringae TaxID=52694 RepID=UPI0020348F0F|nr:hypothetical protein [Acetobacterium wieringae]URN85748.1 hypothetical protein CHL1_001421 [Acetobacterium wieringae]